MFVEYIYMNNTTPKWHAEHSETKTFHSNWKNETLIETELTTLIKIPGFLRNISKKILNF